MIDSRREKHGIELPEAGHYATGIFFMDKTHHAENEKIFEELAAECSLKVILIKINYDPSTKKPQVLSRPMLSGYWEVG